ncbi:MAG: zinc ABC transporter substrate-binding protein [Dysgonamonadaceae bacterium]|nr:zinc ABC transporter substrate-binding protein [Dysgonamonadaceae bacterium]
MNNSIKYTIFLVLLLLCSCRKSVENSEKPLIFVTIEPQRYFIEQLVDTLFRVETMTPPGASPETYDPLPEKMSALAKAKAYFSVGHLGFEEAWLDKLQKNYPQILFFETGEGITPIATEHRHGNHIHTGIDPHIWTSPLQALKMADNMRKALISIDSINAEVYNNNFLTLRKKILSLNKQIREILGSVSRKAFIIYHPALGYFARDYGLEQLAMENDGKEPSPMQLKMLLKTASEKHITTVFIQQEFDRKNAESIAKSAGCKLVEINPLSYNWEEETLKIANALKDE